jgi:pilus assembly protein TadC
LLNITQTNVFGNNILETMYDQIDFLRDKQILEIKGEMNKIPLKISIVSVIFIVPLILLLVLGPFIISFL